MLGLYPPIQSKQLSPGEYDSLRNGKAMPKVMIRKSRQLYENFQQKSIIDGYQFIPVFNYLERNLNDDTIFDNCPYANERKTHNENDPAAFKEVADDYLSVLRDSITKAFNLTQEESQNLEMPRLGDYGDLFRCEDFEGDKRRFEFTSQEVYYLRTLQRDGLRIPCGEEGRQLFMTKQFRKPMTKMLERIRDIIFKNQTEDSLRVWSYSAHDDTISNGIPFLQPINYEIVDIPYASSFVFEAYFNQSCLDALEDPQMKRQCFKILSYHNNNPLQFQTCQQSNIQKGLGKGYFCQLDDFLEHLSNVSFKGDITKACQQQWTPPDNNFTQRPFLNL
ncbi:UNKNOWN [Stylonychia lemnae]|uniref:Histidine acid phosphatase family protein n=1 Tax=Stylonychia lemnae TaxID=5949 RepID=A0A078BBW9_STYLE|nr:UNKNOWN [Stylonychia lemnae]|eukprot:CDW90747.1 UNKNOWN [Stylonychia lemnae]